MFELNGAGIRVLAEGWGQRLAQLPVGLQCGLKGIANGFREFVTTVDFRDQLGKQRAGHCIPAFWLRAQCQGYFVKMNHGSALRGGAQLGPHVYLGPIV